MSTTCYMFFAQAGDLTGPNRHNKMTTKAGHRKFGQEVVATIAKEFTQLNGGAVSSNPVVIPTDATTITSLEKKKALRAVNFIKEKCSGDLKGHICVDGSS